MRFALAVSLVTWILVTSPGVGADDPVVVRIWPGDAPDEAGGIGAEKFRMSPELDRKQVEVTESTKMVTNVP